MRDTLVRHISEHLRLLTAHPDRHVGGPGNRAATALFAEKAAAFGFAVARRTFDCVEWEYGGVLLEAAGRRFEAHPGPYSLPCDIRALLTAASVVEELETERIRGTIVLLHDELVSGQLMPKNFTFYNPDSHKRIIRALEEHPPAAVIAATGRDPQMVGSQYPFPLIEDGDFDVPSAYMKDVDGQRLLAHRGEETHVSIDSRRVPATAEHLVATKPGSSDERHPTADSDAPADDGTARGCAAAHRRVVVFAHIDSRKGSPGALDNAAGVAALLALTELLADYGGGLGVELVPLNGEDHYAAPGEMLWITDNQGRFDEIVLGVNIDDAGRRGQATHVSFYGCPADVEQVVRTAMARRTGFTEGPQWFQSDHAIFGLHGRPAIAIASADMAGFMAEYAHSPRDTIELAEPATIAEIACFVRDVIVGLDKVSHTDGGKRSP